MKIHADHVPTIGFAAQQNGIRSINKIVITNDGAARENLTLRVTTDPAFSKPAEMRIDAIGANDEYPIDRLDISLSGDYLRAINEKTSGWLQFEVKEEDGTILCTCLNPVSLLAWNEWSGLKGLPEILAAFVLPNDPAVAKIIGAASELLRMETGNGALNGYQSGNRQRVLLEVAAIYKALAAWKISYIGAPASFEESGQKIRFPSQIIHDGFGTCLDLALLFAACFEAIGLHPFVFIQDGHAFAGCWLAERTLPDAACEDIQTIRKLADEKLITCFEATAVTSEMPTVLSDAERLAAPRLEDKKKFHHALDVKRARVARILPIPVPGQPFPDVIPAPPKPNGADGGLGVPAFDETPRPQPDGAGIMPRARIPRYEFWKRQSLDLSTQNPALNFGGRHAIRFRCTSLALMGGALMEDIEHPLLPSTKSMLGKDPRDKTTMIERQGTDAATAEINDALARGNFHTCCEEKEHARQLTKFHRANRNAAAETGDGTLSAALGVLEWLDPNDPGQPCRAPIVFVQVELRRKSRLEGFSLTPTDKEPAVNNTLLEKLRRDFGMEMPGLDPLPECKDGGVDVNRVMQIFRNAVRDVSGWEVREEAWLGLFPKSLIHKDISEREGENKKNPVIRRFMIGPEDAEAAIAAENQNPGAEIPESPEAPEILPEQLDAKFSTKDRCEALSADSSQRVAIEMARFGRDFVLEGPPGTGKSQTSTNIVVNDIVQGKRVLFTAQKRVALDVPCRRMELMGLSEFCLPLYSEKTGKSEVYALFERRLRLSKGKIPTEWAATADALERERDTLNGHLAALHTPSTCGLSAYDCFNHWLPRREETVVRFENSRGFPDIQPEQLAGLRKLVALLQERAFDLMPLHNHPLGVIAWETWSPRASDDHCIRIRELAANAANAGAVANDFLAWAGSPDAGKSLPALGRWRELGGFLLPTPAFTAKEFLTTPWPQLADNLDTWTALARERAQLRARLQGYDLARLTTLPLGELLEKWKAAQSANWLKRRLACDAIRRKLLSCGAGSPPHEKIAIGQTLVDAIRLRELDARFSAAQASPPLPLALWNNGEPDIGALEKARAWGATLHAHLRACAEDDTEKLARLSEKLAPLFGDAGDSRDSSAARAETLSRLKHYCDTLDAHGVAFDSLAGEIKLRREPFEQAADYFATARALLENILPAWLQIRAWCAWQSARRQAMEACLGSIVAHSESEAAAAAAATLDLPALFELGFRRALLFELIERDNSLKMFFSTAHEEAIARFCELDEKLRNLTHAANRHRLLSLTPVHGDALEAEMIVLQREIQKTKGRRMPVRRLLSAIPNLLGRLMPCIFTTPDAIAQHLDASHKLFDRVIIEEASQMRVHDAIVAIGRGKRLLVLGDPKQLPPTDFFTKGDADLDIVPLADREAEGTESVLDEMIACRFPRVRLEWHYRSRKEELITFSNCLYYDGRLRTFPQSSTKRDGLKLVHLPKAVYDKGGSRTNSAEARALVDELVNRLRAPAIPPRSYLVATFNQAQQQLVENYLDEARRSHPEIEHHFGSGSPVPGEPLIVKNLENVQGDERDVVMISIGYGPDENGRLSLNFGPLNRDGGERRLNVVVSRARHEKLVFTSLRPEMIDLSRTQARGVRDLKLFLDYAERGMAALPAADRPAAAVPDGIELMVAGMLREAGYEVHHHVGSSSGRVDLAVVAPNDPGRYLAGLLFDGPGCLAIPTARDCYKLRRQVLQDLGWQLYHIWIVAWGLDLEGEKRRLLRRLASLAAAQPPATHAG